MNAWGDLFQCVYIYTKAERGISYWSVIAGDADATAHSLNRVLYGVFEGFLEHFGHVTKAYLSKTEHFGHVTKASLPKTVSRYQRHIDIYDIIIFQLNIRERLFYVRVGFQQRGKVPMKLGIKNGLPTYLFFGVKKNATYQTKMDELDRHARAYEAQQKKIAEERRLAMEAKMSGANLAQPASIPTPPPASTSSNPDAEVKKPPSSALVTMANAVNDFIHGKKDKATKDEMEATTRSLGFIKDVYHQSIKALLETCHESITGLNALLDNVLVQDVQWLYAAQYRQLFDQAQRERPGSSKYKRLLLRATEELFRYITRIYFQFEYESKENEFDMYMDRIDLQFLRRIFTPESETHFQPTAKSSVQNLKRKPVGVN